MSPPPAAALLDMRTSPTVAAMSGRTQSQPQQKSQSQSQPQQMSPSQPQQKSQSQSQRQPQRLPLPVLVLLSCSCALMLLLGLPGFASADQGPGIASCVGRHVYMHELPSRFNSELVFDDPKDTRRDENNRKLLADDVLQILKLSSYGAGFGKVLPIEMGGSSLEGAWYQTEANSLERVFHSRMLSYPCRVTDYKEADLIYVPYFGRQDFIRHMGKENLQRDRLVNELTAWMKGHPAWQRSNGSDHFWVLGSPVWDFFRDPDANGWGNSLLKQEGIRENVWTVCIETFWAPRKVISAPYPTGFHPKNWEQVQEWQKFVKAQERKYLFAFAGAQRPSESTEGKLRNKLFWQCANSARLGDNSARLDDNSTRLDDNSARLDDNSASCSQLDCSKSHHSWRCHDVSQTYGLYLNAKFCLHPIGDSCTRRSLLDAALAGCIPVVFYPCTLQDQYQWHLKSVKTSEAFVYIPAKSVKGPEPEASGEGGEGGAGNSDGDAVNSVLVEEVLRKIPEERVQAMREALVEAIPLFTYGGELKERGINAPDFKDGIDVILDGLAENIKRAAST